MWRLSLSSGEEADVLPSEQQCPAPFHMSVGRRHLFFGKMSIQMLCPFFCQVAWVFLMVNCNNFGY